MFFVSLFLLAILGVLLRYFISSQFNNYSLPFLENIPLGTFLVNVLGSFFIGVVYSFQSSSNTSGITSGQISGEWKLLLAIGLLGALTTFSSFSLEVVTLLEKGRVFLGLSYVLLTNLLSIVFCWFGILTVRFFN